MWSLTVSREYEVLGIEADQYRIMDDTDEPYLFAPECFEVVDSSEPSFWVESRGDDGERYAYPPEWAHDGFFEDYFDGLPHAKSTFSRVLQERWS
jgi:hypothetical protein